MKIKSKKKNKTSDKKKPSESAWSKVKIAGNLVTNDGGGLEGLIGLEVLENYDIKTITKSKVTKHCLKGLSIMTQIHKFLENEKERKRRG